MIDPEVYQDSENHVLRWYGSKRPHFDLREPSVTVSSRQKMLEFGETLQNISEAVFGKNKARMWPYLCDNNITRHVDDWVTEDVVNIPELVVVPKPKNQRSSV